MVRTRIPEIGGQVPTNGALETISASMPFTANITLKGTSDMLFHRWNCEEVEAKAGAAKGSKAKKTDNIESYVYRNDKQEICCPGEYLRQVIIHAAKYRQDPRSPRKSAMDLYKAGIINLTIIAPIHDADGKVLKTWQYEHKCRAVIQRAAITRTRPAIKEGWSASFQMLVNLPEYIRPNDLHDVIVNGGRLIGLADMRPTYGRFAVTAFDVGME